MLGEGSTQGLGDMTLTPESIYSINFTLQNKRFILSLHHNGEKQLLIC